MWLYNGAAPGPLLELCEGDHVRIRLDNHLPQDTTVHWHGLLVPPDQDGNPMDPVRPGASHVYEFDVPMEPREPTGITRTPTATSQNRSRVVSLRR